MQPFIIPAKSGGALCTVDVCEVFNTLFRLARIGHQWDTFPYDLLARSISFDYLQRWQDDGTRKHLLDALR